MEEKETAKELTEVPLSNREVLKVLKARTCDSENEGQKHHPRTVEMMEYLDSVEKGPYNYPLEVLRDLKNNGSLEADLITLTMVSNTSDLGILNNSDRKKIEQHFTKKRTQC
jgi:hypothetical protein